MNAQYLAGFELSQANVEQLVFDNVGTVRDQKPGSTDPDDHMAARLNGDKPETAIGTSILLKTMPGDRFNVSVDALYDGDYTQDQALSGNDIVKSLMTTLTGGTDYSGVPVSELPANVKDIQTIFNNPNLAGQLDQLTSANNNIYAPKAHLNYLFFDDRFNLVASSSGAVQVATGFTGWQNLTPVINGSGSGTGTFTGHTGVIQCNTCSTPGILVVYIDNQSIGKDVWFDHMMIGHYTSAVVSEDHYYPFGLAMSIDQSTTVAPNTKKYQGIELEKHFGLENYETFYRGLDPQLGRFNQFDPKAESSYSESPFAAMGNNPVLMIDPLGNTDYNINNTDINFNPKTDRIFADEVVVSATRTVKPEYTYYNIMQAAGRDIGRNDAVRAKTNAGINGLYGTLAAGAAAPLAVVIGLESTPAVVASYLSNPVAWNEFGATTILGAAGYEGGAPGAGTMEGAVTEEGGSTIYRAMSTAEVDDVAKYGFRMNAGGYETGKLFAPTLNEATQFGKYNFGLDGIPNTIMKVQVPNNVLNSATKFGADGMNAISIPASQLNLLKGTPLNYSPIN